MLFVHDGLKLFFVHEEVGRIFCMNRSATLNRSAIFFVNQEFCQFFLCMKRSSIFLCSLRGFVNIKCPVVSLIIRHWRDKVIFFILRRKIKDFRDFTTISQTWICLFLLFIVLLKFIVLCWRLKYKDNLNIKIILYSWFLWLSYQFLLYVLWLCLGLIRSPCGVCPVIKNCCDSGSIRPQTCQYFKDWLDF